MLALTLGQAGGGFGGQQPRATSPPQPPHSCGSVPPTLALARPVVPAPSRSQLQPEAGARQVSWVGEPPGMAMRVQGPCQGERGGGRWWPDPTCAPGCAPAEPGLGQE